MPRERHSEGRSALEFVDGLRPLLRNLALNLVGMIGHGVSATLVLSFLPTIARRAGLDPLGLAALTATPFIAALLSVFAGRLGPRSTHQLALARGVGAGSLVTLPLLPIPSVIIAATLVFWICVTFSTPFQLRLWGAMSPARMRGRVVGFLGTGRAAASVLAALAGALAADRLGGPTAVAISGIVGAACALAYAGLRVSAASMPPDYSPHQSIRAILERPTLRRVALAQGLLGGAVTAAAPLFALVNVDRLDLSLADVGIIGVLTAGATTVSSLASGVVADRFGALAPMRIGSVLGLAGLLTYAFAPDVAALWLAAVALGTSAASIEVGIFAVISDETPFAARATAMSGWAALSGVRGLLAAFSISTLVEIRVVDVTIGLLLCSVAAGLGAALFWWAARRAMVEA